jgi:exodeoxyribonuclease VII small subunit
MTRTLRLLCASAKAEKKTAPRRKILPAQRPTCDFNGMKYWFVFRHSSLQTQAGILPMTPNWTSPFFCFTLVVVPNPSKSAGQNNPARARLPFEEALKKLEGIVEAMESDDLPLETLLSKYEEGTKLVKICQEKLAEAELKIQQLEKNAAGEMKLKPLSPDLSEG